MKDENGIQSGLIVIAVKTDLKAEPKHKGVSLLVIKRDSPGYSRGRKLNKVKEYEIARHYQEIPVASIYEGTNEIMKTIIAKKLGL